MNQRLRCYVSFVVLWMFSTVLVFWTTAPERNNRFIQIYEGIVNVSKFRNKTIRAGSSTKARSITLPNRSNRIQNREVVVLGSKFQIQTIKSGLSFQLRNSSQNAAINTVNSFQREQLARSGNMSNETLKSRTTSKSTRKVPNHFDTEREYFKPRSWKVNPMNAEFLIPNRKFCDGAMPFLIIMVPSIHRNIAVRDAIRNTYGSYKKHVNLTVKVIFLFGTSSNSSDVDILEESRKYGDIVQADFKDSYQNLTYKILYGLKWVSTYCSEVEFIVKADEDAFVYVPYLLDYLKNTPYGSEGAIYGFVYGASPVQRKGKWAVTYKEYPLPRFPSYISGISYVVSGNIASRLFSAAEHMPYVPVEDAFITGCLTKIIGAKRITNKKFSHWLSPRPTPCSAVGNHQLTSTKTTLSLFLKLWEALISFDEVCGEKRTKSLTNDKVLD